MGLSPSRLGPISDFGPGPMFDIVPGPISIMGPGPIIEIGLAYFGNHSPRTVITVATNF